MIEIKEKMKAVMKLAEALEKSPRKYGTDELLTPSEIHLIEAVGDADGNPSVTDTAKLLGITKGAVSQNLKRLERKGLTVKRPDPQNSSRSIVSLTPKGEAAYDAHKHWHRTMDGGFQAYCNTLEEDKIEFLREFLSRTEDFYRRLLLSGE